LTASARRRAKIQAALRDEIRASYRTKFGLARADEASCCMTRRRTASFQRATRRSTLKFRSVPRRRGWIARCLLLSSRIIASIARDDCRIRVSREQVALDESA
jgi:hypothetical protein